MARDEAYRKAEKKIEEARRSEAKELDLRNSELTDLPETIGKLTKLRTLDLGGDGRKEKKNQLTALPESLGRLTQLQSLDLSNNQLTALPEWLGQLTQLQSLDLSKNQLTALPEWLGQLNRLQILTVSNNQLTALPEWLGQLTHLEALEAHSAGLSSLPKNLPGSITRLQLGRNQLNELPLTLRELKSLRELIVFSNGLHLIPDWIGELVFLELLILSDNQISQLPDSLARLKNLTGLHLGFQSIGGNPISQLPQIFSQLVQLKDLILTNCNLTDIPTFLADFEHLQTLDLDGNPLSPELAAAHLQGLDAVKAYLRAKATAQVSLFEAKLILVGEGEVGKSCMLGALRNDPWEEGRPTTHGIEIKPVKVNDSESGREITLNGWDFGGQRVYRPTHQLFFSAPAVYLVVWKPREGPQQGFVKEWIRLIKHREPDAKILVVATHGGPGQRQPDIDRQELRDLFGADTVLGFFHVESKPDENGERRGIPELKDAIARLAASLPEMGRTVPKRWQEAREALQQNGAAYLSLDNVLALCRDRQMDDEEARLFITISHRLGHLTHYQHDPALRDIVVLKPDWLATAISFVLDDEATRRAHGLVSLSRLSQLWDDPTRAEFRYPATLHPVFLRLMERFDLSYRVAGLHLKSQSDETSLIAQLVPDNRPEEDLARKWPLTYAAGDSQQVQICRIVDDKGQSGTAEGLFYQLIVRLHKYSLGRLNYSDSVHWQRGLVLDDDYNGRALLEHIGNDVRITVRAPYPERFLAMLTGEVKYLVEGFWEGLRCDVMVPCIEPCGRRAPGTGLFEVEKLIESKRKKRPEYPCQVCNEWQDIDGLLRNAPAARPMVTSDLIWTREVIEELRGLRHFLVAQRIETMGRFDSLDAGQRELLSKADASYTGLMQALTDEAKEGPRLFSLVPVDRSNFNPKEWMKAKFRLTLWCEHSRLPLPSLDGKVSKKGVYEIELTREWFKKAAPFLKVLTATLSLVLPVASTGIKLALDDTAYKAIEEQLDFSKEIIDASLGGSEKISTWLAGGTSTEIAHGEAIRAEGATLRELQALLKSKDPGFGGLVRVMNKRQEFLWVHAQFEKEY